MRYFFAFAFFLFASQLSAQSTSWEKTTFPDSNYVYFISLLGDKVFAGSYSGLYLSVDEGVTWKNMTQDFGIISVNDLLFQDSVYYLSSWVDKVWKSTDLTSWEPLGDGLPPYVTALEFFDGKLYAATSNSVYTLNTETKAWDWDGLSVKINHNDYILDLAARQNSVLYASGCEFLYAKVGDAWQIIDTSYSFCGGQIRDNGGNIFVNTTGSGIQKYGADGINITETFIANAQDPASWSAADFAFYEGKMLITSQKSLYYPDLDSSEVVCGELLTSVALGFENIFVGTQIRGIWKKGAHLLWQGGSSDRNAAGVKSSRLQFDLSPTPSDGRILANIRMEVDQHTNFSIFDDTGKMILTQKVNTSVDLEIHLSTPGLYMAVLSNDKERLTRRIIIQ